PSSGRSRTANYSRRSPRKGWPPPGKNGRAAFSPSGPRPGRKSARNWRGRFCRRGGNARGTGPFPSPATGRPAGKGCKVPSPPAKGGRNGSPFPFAFCFVLVLSLFHRLLIVTYHLKAFQFHRFVRADPRLPPGNRHLFFGGLNPLQVREEQTAAVPPADNHPVFLGIKVAEASNRFRGFQDIHGIDQILQFVFADRRETGVLESGGQGVCHDFPGKVFPGGIDRPDTAPEFAVFFYGD